MRLRCFTHIASSTVEEGVKSYKQRGKFNQPPSIFIKTIKLGRRYFDYIEYGDGKVMLNSVAPLFVVQSISYCASSKNMEAIMPELSTFRSPTRGCILDVSEQLQWFGYQPNRLEAGQVQTLSDLDEEVGRWRCPLAETAWKHFCYQLLRDRHGERRK